LHQFDFSHRIADIDRIGFNCFHWASSMKLSSFTGPALNQGVRRSKNCCQVTRGTSSFFPHFLEQTDQLNVALQTGDVVIGIRESLPDALQKD